MRPRTAPLLRVLLVDDDPMVLQGLGRALRGIGYTVVSAPDVASARTQLDHHDFDVVVTDIWMPDGNGLDVFDAIRSSDPDVSVIFFSGETALPSTLSTSSRAVRYLAKTTDHAALVGTIEEAGVECRRVRGRRPSGA